MDVRTDPRLEDETGPHALPSGPPVSAIIALGIASLAVWIGVPAIVLALIP